MQAIKEIESPLQAPVHCWVPSLSFPPFPLASKSLRWERDLLEDTSPHHLRYCLQYLFSENVNWSFSIPSEAALDIQLRLDSNS